MSEQPPESSGSDLEPEKDSFTDPNAPAHLFPQWALKQLDAIYATKPCPNCGPVAWKVVPEALTISHRDIVYVAARMIGRESFIVVYCPKCGVSFLHCCSGLDEGKEDEQAARKENDRNFDLQEVRDE